MTLQLLREHQLYAKPRKCDFYRDRIQHLGHIISEEGISVDLENIDAIMNWPTPRNVTDLLWDLQDTTRGKIFYGTYRILLEVH